MTAPEHFRLTDERVDCFRTLGKMPEMRLRPGVYGISCTELEARQIPRILVETVLESPEQKNAVLENISCYQSRVEISGKHYLLRVLVNETVQPPVVVTAYRTSKIRKYWRES